MAPWERRAPSGRAPGATKRWSCATATGPASRQRVLRAVENVNGEIAGAVRTRRAGPGGTDDALVADGTPNKGRLGANAILHLPRWRAAAASRGSCRCTDIRRRQAATLPVPQVNIPNGGRHGRGH
jgi:enolase